LPFIALSRASSYCERDGPLNSASVLSTSRLGQASLGFTAFRKKLDELGYVEGQNIVFECRWSDQSSPRTLLRQV
jgi:hypothetical protein